MEGTIRVLRPGVAEVACAEGTFPVARGGIREAMDADRVRVSLVSRSGTQMVVVQGVIERATSSFLGTYHDLDPLGVVVALDRRMQHDFFVTPGDTSVERLSCDLCSLRPGVDRPTSWSRACWSIPRARAPAS